MEVTAAQLSCADGWNQPIKSKDGIGHLVKNTNYCSLLPLAAI